MMKNDTTENADTGSHKMSYDTAYLLERRRAWRADACSASQALTGFDPIPRACKCADRVL